MKYFLRFLCFLLLFCLAVSAGAEGIKFTDIEPGKEYAINLKKVAELKGSDYESLFYRLA